MKHFLIASLFFLLSAVAFVPAVSAQEGEVLTPEKTVDVYVFHGEGCPHCHEELAFLDRVKEEYDFVNVHDFEVWKDASSRELMQAVAESLNVDIGGVPFTIIGDQYITGYASDDTTGELILSKIARCLTYECEDVVAPHLTLTSATDILDAYQSGADVSEIELSTDEEKDESGIDQEIALPFIGVINAADFSLPALTVLIGGLDGFNPCAMWTLLFLISLLVNMENKRRMWMLGSAFIVASAFVYFLFMSAWLNFFLFIGFIFWIRMVIGGVAIASGLYNLKEYKTNKEGVCKVTSNDKRQKTFQKLRNITQHNKFWIALGGIILLAFAVNLVELVCSAGLPAVYTQILTMSELATWQYYGYLLLYIFVFMLDDLFVFFISMKALQVTGITTKYTRWSHLIGGILMLILGLLLIFKPGLLMFG